MILPPNPPLHCIWNSLFSFVSIIIGYYKCSQRIKYCSTTVPVVSSATFSSTNPSKRWPNNYSSTNGSLNWKSREDWSHPYRVSLRGTVVTQMRISKIRNLSVNSCASSECCPVSALLQSIRSYGNARKLNGKRIHSRQQGKCRGKYNTKQYY